MENEILTKLHYMRSWGGIYLSHAVNNWCHGWLTLRESSIIIIELHKIVLLLFLNVYVYLHNVKIIINTLLF